MASSRNPAKTLGEPVTSYHYADHDIVHGIVGGQHIHLNVLAGAKTDQPLAALIPLGMDGFDRVEAVLRLLASLHGRAIPPDTRMTAQQRSRARRMLQAIDGHRDGATQLEIASAVFRMPRMSRDEWQAAPERYAIMDLINEGRSMIQGGYRRLLRHKRRY